MEMQKLIERAQNACELCEATQGLKAHYLGEAASARLGSKTDASVLVCENCDNQINDQEPVDANHWRCLNNSMWSPEIAVQLLSWRMLDRLSATQDWAADARGMMYLDDDLLALVSDASDDGEDAPIRHVDANGTELSAGDTVILIKDLNVKGASFTAKRGTSVRKISLVSDNAEHIEGRVNDQQIVILTKFVKKG